MKNLVSTDWLADHFQDPDLVILDASPKSNAAGLVAPFATLQILGARIFDIKGDFSDLESSLPNMMPSPSQFESECQKLGISRSSRIVVYDNLGVYSSPRVWWMFKVMGHENVAVLDGGFPAWKEAGLPSEAIQKNDVTHGDFRSNFQASFVKNMSQVSNNKDGLVIDARSKARFDGTVAEAREHLKSGRIPGSLSLPFLDLLKDGYFISEQEIREKFSVLEVEDRPLIFSCGSGLTACVLILAARLVSDNPLSVYDGSWSEWGQRDDAFIEI